MAGYGLGTRIRATLARILIPGPGTDSLLRIRSGCLPKSTDYLRIFMDFYGLYGLDRYLRDMLWRALERGELLLKSGLNKKNCRFGHTAFRLRSCFYTSRGGGSEAPIRRMARWGLQTIRHGTSFIKINFNPRVCFYDYFSHNCTGRRT